MIFLVFTHKRRGARTMRMYFPRDLCTPNFTAPPLPWFSPSRRIRKISLCFAAYSNATSVVLSELASSTIKTYNRIDYNQQTGCMAKSFRHWEVQLASRLTEEGWQLHFKYELIAFWNNIWDVLPHRTSAVQHTSCSDIVERHQALSAVSSPVFVAKCCP